MRNSVNIFSPLLPQPDIKEILRYAGGGDEETAAHIQACLTECEDLLAPALCYRTFEVTVKGNICDFGEFSVKSSDLAKNLKN